MRQASVASIAVIISLVVLSQSVAVDCVPRLRGCPDLNTIEPVLCESIFLPPICRKSGHRTSPQTRQTSRTPRCPQAHERVQSPRHSPAWLMPHCAFRKYRVFLLWKMTAPNDCPWAGIKPHSCARAIAEVVVVLSLTIRATDTGMPPRLVERSGPVQCTRS
jgi:hypothetical protein